MTADPLLHVEQAVVTYRRHAAVFNREPATRIGPLTFSIQTGQTFGLVGESGSGKSSIARAVACLQSIAAGDILFDGESIRHAKPGRHRGIQMIFQDPDGSLDPRLTITESVQDALRGQLSTRSRRRHRARELLLEVGLAESLHHHRSRQLSGGQKQRAAIARALASKPRLLIADEPVSALDVVVQAQILNLLLNLQIRDDLSILLISHDLAVVNHMSDHIGVMQHGELVDIGTAEYIVEHSVQPYTRRLLQAAAPVSTAAVDLSSLSKERASTQ
ncbi:ATP-binding cassette domain-containing protein [Mycolicibacterium sp.]|uniref:ATP-binding cassette domain-containing protein n=1 Tax=Mycolicibacterium sp. TaxID=2320850 RepID=UPI0037CB6A60